MAKCKYYGEGVGNCPKDKNGFCIEYSNCTDGCNIRPSKKKSRYKRIKAWASILESFRTGKREMHKVSLEKSITCVIPCTILIEAKYLRGNK